MQLMKKEHFQLSREAHKCVDSIPELNKMVFAVQALGMLDLLSFLIYAFSWTNVVVLQLHSVKILK